ncbi:MAG: DUF1156 domain-containing protein [Proteobacteria bacterium]|nr:DUF1156 domain-containing protein [Pseudomonadota bacterium]
MTGMKTGKKLIEVALPLEAINKESAREKSIRHGHPSTLHLWWARRPLAACRAVLFAQLVDDPSSDPAYRNPDGSVDEERAGIKRAELFNLIEDLVRWENTNNPAVIDRARAEIARCVASRKIELGELQKGTMIFGPEEGEAHPDGPLPKDGRFTAWQVICRTAPPKAVNHFLAEYAPPVLDPFAGGGSIPLEAQRLGLRAHASDLNPVAVLINKALIEIPPKFAGMPPVNHESRSNSLEPLGARASCPQSPFSPSIPKDHKEWYSRGYLPHFDHPDLIQTITFRLYDSVPSSLIQNWQDELNLTQNAAADPRRLATLRERIAKYEDAGHGACFLKNENIAAMVEKAFLHFNDERYRLLAWVVMPNHVHVMIEALPGWPLKDIIHSWKSYTANQANQILNRSGPFWSPDFFDRFIRDERHFLAAKEYIENNPVKAGLCSRPEEWPFSSARRSAAPGNVTPGNASILLAQKQENATKMVALPGKAPGGTGFWTGATGLAEDVRYYGQWMRDAAEKRIGHLYPKVMVTKEMTKDRPDLKPHVGQELTVIAWLWARTVPSPDPSVGGNHVPLVRSFWLSKKKGKEAYVQPIVDRAQGTYEFKEKVGKLKDGFDPDYGTVVRTGARCLISDSQIPFDHAREAGKRGEMKTRLMAIVCEGTRGRVYLSPDEIHEETADCGLPSDYPISNIPQQALGFRVQLYGMDQHWKLFTPRQLTALTTFSDLVSEARDQVLQDATAAGTLPDDNRPLAEGGLGPQAYADAVATYLAFGLSRASDYWSGNATWEPGGQFIGHTFTKQALPMVWDFAESNPFSEGSGILAP